MLGKYSNRLHAKLTLSNLSQRWYSSDIYVIWFCMNDKVCKVVQTALIEGGTVNIPALIMSCSSWCKPWKLHGLTVVIGFMMICIVCKIEGIITYMYISLTLIYFAMLINYDSTVGFLCVYNRDSRRLWKSIRWLKHAMHHIAFSCLCTWYCVMHMYVCLPSFQETPTISRYANRIN